MDIKKTLTSGWAVSIYVGIIVFGFIYAMLSIPPYSIPIEDQMLHNGTVTDIRVSGNGTDYNSLTQFILDNYESVATRGIHPLVRIGDNVTLITGWNKHVGRWEMLEITIHREPINYGTINELGSSGQYVPSTLKGYTFDPDKNTFVRDYR